MKDNEQGYILYEKANQSMFGRTKFFSCELCGNERIDVIWLKKFSSLPVEVYAKWLAHGRGELINHRGIALCSACCTHLVNTYHHEIQAPDKQIIKPEDLFEQMTSNE